MNGAQYENQQESGPNPSVQDNYTNPEGQRPIAPQQDFRSAPNSRQHKSPLLATLFSCMPGLGQVYVGYYQQGFMNILIAAGTIALLASNAVSGMQPFFGTSLAFFWIYNMIDANRRAHHFNRAVDGLGSEEIPEDFQLPTSGGSMLWGVIVMAIGVMIIVELKFNMSMAWVKVWWPLALVAFGGNLIYRARKKAA